MKRWIMGLLFGLLLSSSAFAGSILPLTLPTGAHLISDIAYGSDPLQKLDVYIPKNASNAPVIFMVHGGGWEGGDKASPKVVDNKVGHYLPLGYLFVSVNYRLVPKVDPVQEAQDVAQALTFVQQRVKALGGDPSRIVLMGHSAGANLIAQVAASKSYMATLKPWLGNVELDSAGYNIVEIMRGPHISLYDKAFGRNQPLWIKASPTLQVDHKIAPMLGVCSTQHGYSCGQVLDFKTAAEKFGGDVQAYPVNMDHSDIDVLLGAPNAMTARVDAFLKSLGLPIGNATVGKLGN